MGSTTCYVCGHLTLDERCDWEICPVCFWEDDVLVIDGNDPASSANRGLKVSAAQANFIQFGACDEEMVSKVRLPTADEPIDPTWRPFDVALDLASELRKPTS